MTICAKQLWAALPVPALILDDHNLIAEANPVAESVFNQSARTLIHQPIVEKARFDIDLLEVVDRARQNDAPVRVNDAMLTIMDRDAIPCQLQISPMERGQVLLLIQPANTANGIAGGHAVGKAARSAIGMAEMLAHEIKNPLAGISGAAQLLSLELTGEDREMTDLIVTETRRIVKLLDQVEEFGNVLPPDRRAVNLHDILDRARRSAQVGYAEKVEISQDYDPSLPLTFGDADQLVQVFLNLLKNACEAIAPIASPAAKITVRSYYDHGMRARGRDGSQIPLPLQVEVIDNGPGLPSDIADHIFDPFVSGRENGTGLGLALVSKIISDHGGWIGVDSIAGRTVFRVSLPIAPREGLVPITAHPISPDSGAN